MTTAIDPTIQQKPLNVEEFLARYGDDNRYELIDREVFVLDQRVCTFAKRLRRSWRFQPFLPQSFVFKSMAWAFLGLSCNGYYYGLRIQE